MNTVPLKRLRHSYWLLAVFCVWMLAHPYRGIWHDGLLYMVQALHNIQPQAFSHDVFFQFGSQDQFTLFSPLYSAMITHLGISVGCLTLLCVCHALSAVALYSIARALLPSPLRWLGVLLVVGMPGFYGALDVFSYGETFLTARSPAEAISLCAIAANLHRKPWLAILLALFATLLHPLIGIWALLWMLTLHVGWQRCVPAGLLLIGLALALEPQHILQHLDGRWESLVKANAGFLFILHWGSPYWQRSLLSFATLIWAMQCASETQRRFWAVLCGLVIFGAMLSAIADVFNAAFLLQIQPWRVLWLATAMSWLAILSIAQRIHRSPGGWFWLLAWFGTWVLRDSFGSFITLILVWPLWQHRERWQSHIPETLRRHARILRLGMLLFILAAWMPIAIEDGQLAGGNILYNNSLTQQFINGIPISQLFCLPILLIWALGWRVTSVETFPAGKLPRLAALSLAGWLLLGGYSIYAIRAWDQRDALSRYIETTYNLPQPNPLPLHLRPNSTLLWPGLIEFNWLGLRTGSYFSGKQVSGIIFNRQTALESYRRAWRTVLLGVNLEGVGDHISVKELSSRLIPTGIHFDDDMHSKVPVGATASGLIYACQDPVLDYVVLGAPITIAGVLARPLRLPVRPYQQWIYDCENVRQHFGLRPDIQVDK